MATSGNGADIASAPIHNVLPWSQSRNLKHFSGSPSNDPFAGMSIASPNAFIQKIALIPKKKNSTARHVGADSRRQAADSEVSPFLPVSRLRRSRASGNDRPSRRQASFTICITVP
jgi:hypothetical protein